MQLFNEQSQLFMVAAICMAAGFGFLYLALGLYGMLIDRALHWVGVHAAIASYIKQNRKAWWCRMGTWYDRRIINREL